VKNISQYRENINKVSQQVWVVLSAKLILLLGVSLIFVFALFSIDKLHKEMWVMLFTFIAVFADVLMPLFFFRGMEEMKYIAIFNIISKLLYAVGVYMFINNESDYVYVPLLNSITLLCVSLYALFYIHHKFNIEIVLPTFKDVIDALKEGKDIFLSNMSVSFYTTINPILLGIFGSYVAVGIYSLAEAIYNAYSSIIKSYTMVIYPHLARYIGQLEKLYIQARKFFLLYMLILLIATLILLSLSNIVITLLYGNGHADSITILQILAIALLLEPLGGFFTSYLSLKSQYKVIRSITWRTMIVNLILVVPMIHFFGAKGLAYLFLLLSVIQVYLNISNNKEILSGKNINRSSNDI
jgi:PST family polysaccharide transporter